MEQEELKEETKIDLNRQQYVNDAEETGLLTIKEGLEEDIPEAAVVGIDDDADSDE